MSVTPPIPEESAEASTPSLAKCESLSDRALLRLFVSSRNEEAFRQLVERHAALVLGTCRRGAPSLADADDAFQATFLVLAQSAGKIRRRDALGAWLYGVATRVCLRMRRQHARRSASQLTDVANGQDDPLDELLARHDETVADEELNALPESLRTPLVLRYLVGKNNADVADELGITVAALEGRLKRGKQQLRVRLLRRGVTLVTMVALLKATRVHAAEVPAELIANATTLCTGAVNLSASSLAAEPSSATHFALQELNAMNTLLASKPLIATFAVGTLAALTVTAQLAFSQGDSSGAANPFGLEAAVREGEPATAQAPTTSLARGTRASDPFGNVEVAVEVEAEIASEPDSPAETNATTQPEFAKNPPGIVDLKQRTPSEVAIELALPKQVGSAGLEFVDAPLAEVVDFLQSEYNIPIVIDSRALEDLGLSSDDPVTVSARNIKLESALNLLLRQLELTYLVRDEVLQITSLEEALVIMEVRAYPVDFLKTDSDEVAKLITSTVEPDSWNQVWGVSRSGDGSFTAEKSWQPGRGEGVIAHEAGNRRLVIRQTYAVHQQINKLLSELKQAGDIAREDTSQIQEAERGIFDIPLKKHSTTR